MRLKKIISSILVLCILFSCWGTVPRAYATTDDEALTDAEAVTADKGWLTYDLIRMNNADQNHITGNLNLPTWGEKGGSTIHWTSSDKTIVTAGGEVIRPAANLGNKTVTLTADLSQGTETAQSSFTVTVLAKESTDDVSLDSLLVRTDYNWLTYPLILNSNDQYGVETDLNLPTQGTNGCAINWASSDSTVIAPNGKVTRPSHLYVGNDCYYYSVTLTATISKGDAKSNKTFIVSVATLNSTPDETAVEKDYNALTYDDILNNNNNQDSIMTDLDLPIVGQAGSSISWASSDETLIKTDGKVTRPSNNLTGYKKVTLTATISKGDTKQNKQFSVCVLCVATTEDEIAAEADYNWLSDEIIQKDNISLQNVETNLYLPTEGKYGSTISWATTDNSMVSTDGKVTRPTLSEEGHEEFDVILTATILKGDVKIQKEFKLLLPFEAVSEDVRNDYNWLEHDVLTQGDGYIYFDSLEHDLYFPTQGENGSTISWNSTNEAVVATDGTVHRPSYEQGDTAVTVTATISKEGSATLQKVFKLTVVSLSPQGAESVVLDKAWLTDKLILNGNSADDVKNTLLLPNQGKYGSNISWASSSPAVDAETGKVIRPSKNQDDVKVTLTAHIFYNDGERAADDQKTFNITVTKKENIFLAVNQNDFSHINGLQQNGHVQTADINGKTAIHFDDNATDESSGGSVFTKNKIHLNDDMSFSTSFSLKANYVSDKSLSGDGGFTFTLQAAGSNKYGTGKTSLGVSGVEPSVSVGVHSCYGIFGEQGSSWYENDRSAKVFTNGNQDGAREYSLNLNSGTAYTVWIEYNGTTKTIEIRVANNGEARPDDATAVISGLDLSSVFKTEAGKAIQDVYAGFTGGAGGAKDSFDIWDWSLQNGMEPIDSSKYTFIDASDLLFPNIENGNVSTNSHQYSLDLSVYKNDGTPAVGIPVELTTSIGTLNESSVVTDSSGKAVVTLSSEQSAATTVEAIASGGATATASVNFAFSDSDCVNLDKEWLTEQMILLGNSSTSNVLTDLNLPQHGLNLSTISWTSNNAAVNAATGKVTLPTAVQGDQTVTLTANISKGIATSVSKTFTVTVKTTDNAYAVADQDWLTDSVILNGDGDTDLQHITKDLSLPQTGPNGSTISWWSNNPEVNYLTGKVTRPLYANGDTSLTLTATLKHGTAAALTKEFHVVIQAQAPSDAEAVDADKDLLTDAVILNENKALDNILGNLSLPSAEKNGSTIQWVSSNLSIISVDGSVVRPSYSQQNQVVTLTATLTKGQSTTQKKFRLTVVRLPATDQERLDEDAAWLDASRVLEKTENLSQFSIMYNLKLPDKAIPHGSSITWKSDAPAVISDDGTVTRPSYQDGHKSVTLTATITNGTGTVTKALQYTVLAWPDTDAPKIIKTDCSPENGSTKVPYNTTQITLAFNENIQRGSLGGTTCGITLEGPNAPLFYATIDGKKMIITFQNKLTPASQYTLKIPKNSVTDLSGNPLQDDDTLTFTLEQTVTKTLEVVSSNPEDRQKDYSGGSTFTITFDSSNIQKGPAFNKIFVSNRDWGKYTLLSSLNGNTLTLTLGNGNQVLPNHVYEIFIPDGAVQDRFQNRNVEKTIQFCAKGSVVPAVSSVYPLEGEKSVDIHQNIFVHFSCNIFLETNEVTLTDNKGNSVEAGINRIGSDYSEYTIRPCVALQPNTAYTLQIPKTAAWCGDNSKYMLYDYSMSFTTGENSLAAESTSPAAREQGVRIDGAIQIGFSAPVTKSSDSLGATITDASGKNIEYSITENGNKVILTPDTKLESSQTYTVTLPAGTYQDGDAAKNDTLQFQFTTANAVDLSYATFETGPSKSWLVGRPMTFSMESIKSVLDRAGYKLESILWSFGDGSTSQEENPSHTYASAGSYQVTLNLKDNKGHSYQLNGTVTVATYSSGHISMRISPNYNKECLQTDKKTNDDYQTYAVRLAYDGKSMIGESVKVQLYKNGVLQKDLPSATVGSGKTRYVNDFGQTVDDKGIAIYRLWYDYYDTGTYELRFSYGSGDDNVTVRVPVTIRTNSANQRLRFKFYEAKTGEENVRKGGMIFLLDGKLAYAVPEWLNEKDGYVLTIADVPLGKHVLQLPSTYPMLINNDVIYHSGEDYIQKLIVSGKQPGVLSAVSEVSNSNSSADATFIEYVDTPYYTLTVKGDWVGNLSGTYILKTSSGRIISKKSGADEVTFYIKPSAELKAGERLLVGMVTYDGDESEWLDTKIKVISYPDLSLGYDSEISYENGQYTFARPITLPQLLSSFGSDVDSVPGLSNTTLGMLWQDNLLMQGVWDGKKNVKLTFDMGASFGMTKKKKKSKVKMNVIGTELDVDLSGKFIMNYNDSSGQWEVYYQRFTLQGDLTKSYTRAITIPKTKISLCSMTIKIGVLVGGTLIFDSSSGTTKTSAIINFEPHMEGDVQAGPDFANITGSLEGRLPCELQIPKGYFQVDPTITMKVKEKFFWWSKTLYKKTINKEWDNGKEKINLMSFALADGLPSSNDLELTPRNYLSRKFRWMTSGQTRLLLAAAANPKNPNVETRAENVYPDSDVQLIQSNGQLFAIWTDDDSDRSSANRTRLRYSVYNGSSWSSAQWFGTDKTGDFSPAAAAAGDGTLIAWQDMKQELGDDTDASEAAKNCEISVTKEPLTNGGGGGTETLTDDDQFDHSPKLAADGNSALVVWTKSNGLALDVGGTDDSLYFSGWKSGDGWSPAEKIADVGHTVINSNLIMHGNQGLFLYTLDMDGNLATAADQELFARTYNGNSWSNAEQITTNEVEDSNPQAVYSKGHWLIVWEEDGNTVYRIGLQGDTKTADAVSGTGNQFKLTSTGGDNPLTALVYYRTGENGARTLSYSAYDANCDLWSDEIPLTQGDNGYSGSFSPTFTEDGKLKIFYTRAQTVTEVIDGNEYNSDSDKVDLKLLTYTPAHDLALDADDGLQLSSENPLSGTTETVTVTVKNEGDYAENAKVTLYRGDPAANGVKVAEGFAEQPIAAHSSAQVSIDWNVDSNVGDTYDLYAVVTSPNGVTETNEDNNTIHKGISASDIAVTNVECENTAKDNYLMKATLINKGSQILNHVIVNLTDDQSGKVLDTETLEEINPGQMIILSKMISAVGLTKNSSGTINVTLSAALTGGVTDNNTGDNAYQFELEPATITVDRVTPGPGAEQVALQKPITVTFNMNIEKGNGFGGIQLEDESLNSVEITTAIQDNTLTVTPKGKMVNGMQYVLTIPVNALGDSYGHTMERPYTLSFTTTSSNPEVVFANPGSYMENAATDSDIKLKYNQGIVKGPTFGGITVTGADSKKVSATASIEGAWLTLHPAGVLSKSTQYSVTVPTGAVKSAAGEVQQEDYSLSFTTAGSLDTLQFLYDACKNMTQGNYTDSSWDAFTGSLTHAKEVLDTTDVSQEEIDQAVAGLTAAKNALAQKSQHHSSNPKGNDSTVVPAPAQNHLFRSDTIGIYHFDKNAVYYYKIITADTVIPTAVSSNPSVIAVELSKKLPDGYLFKITNIGVGEATITTKAGDGTTVSFTVQGTASTGGIISDTPYLFQISSTKTYQFKFILPAGKAVPTFTTGNNNVIKPILTRKVGNVYYFKIQAVTKGSVGVYVSVPGQPAIRKCVVTVV